MNKNNSSTTPELIRVLIVEDEEITRLGVTMLLQQQTWIELVDALESFDEALRYCKTQRIDILLLDFYLEDGPVTNRILELKACINTPKILLFTSAKKLTPEHIIAIENGANGIFMKHQSLEFLLKAIELINQHETWDFSSNTLTTQEEYYLQNNFKTYEIFGKLTSREKSIAQLVTEGMSTKQIAIDLNIAEKTVRNNLTLIYEKLDVSNRLELCLKVHKN